LIDKVSDDSKSVTFALVLLGMGFVLWAVNRLLGGERLTEERLLAAEDVAADD
jgi:hypothetical protein